MSDFVTADEITLHFFFGSEHQKILFNYLLCFSSTTTTYFYESQCQMSSSYITLETLYAVDIVTWLSLIHI